MIQGVSSISSTIINRFIFSSNVSKKISLPVRPFLSHSLAFKHIRGVPSKKNGEAIPTFKLRILDNLIELFIQLKNTKSINKIYKDINPENIDTLIENIELNIRKQVNIIPPPFGGIFPETGLILNVLV